MHPMVPPGVSASTTDISHPIGPDSRSLSADVADWNPFEEDQPFNQMTEDHIFGEEFDKIRRGSQSSKFIILFVLYIFFKLEKPFIYNYNEKC